ncbi:MAG: ribosomal-protein-alanine N-acetyltransferase [Thermoplasmata archaeon]|nr:MAG: ribosomal-protein-alanine N-acetyltransferase [Thermoplasmata archaeon]
MVMIRQFRLNDLEPVSELVEENFREKYDTNFYLTFYNLWSRGMLVAEDNGNIIGFLLGVVYDSHRGRVLILVVKEGYRGKGIGRAILDKFITICKSIGVTTVTLEVRKSNKRAISFYQKYGFRIVRVIPKYYTDGEDGYEMMLYLGESGGENRAKMQGQ